MACYVCGCAVEEHKDESGPCEECPPGVCIAFEEDEEDDELEDKGGERYESVKAIEDGFATVDRVLESIRRHFPGPQEGAPR